MDLPLVVVVSALGAQGSGVVAAFTTPAQQSRYRVRALTSNASSDAAKALAVKPNVTVAAVDWDSVESIVAAFADATYIFGNTVFHEGTFLAHGPKATQEREARHGLNLARAAAQIPTLRHYVWSTLPDALKVLGPKYDIPHLQSKIPADHFIQSAESGLADKTTFLRVGLYGSNCNRPPYKLMPAEAANKRILIAPLSGDALVPFAGDERANVGLLFRAIIEQPEKSIGRVVLCEELLTSRDWVKAIEKSLRKQGKEIEAVYIDCSLAAYEQMWGAIGTEIGTMMALFGEFEDGGLGLDAGSLPPLRAKDLGVSDQWRSTEARLEDMDWQELM